MFSSSLGYIVVALVVYSVALSGQFFYSTQVSVCIWFLAKNKTANAKRGFSEYRKQTLLIGARKLGTFIDQLNYHGQN